MLRRTYESSRPSSSVFTGLYYLHPKTVFEASDIHPPPPPPTKRIHETRISNSNSLSDSIASSRRQVKSDAAIDRPLSWSDTARVRPPSSSPSIRLRSHTLGNLRSCTYLTSTHFTSFHISFSDPISAVYFPLRHAAADLHSPLFWPVPRIP
jgi:hypothetical protein